MRQVSTTDQYITLNNLIHLKSDTAVGHLAKGQRIGLLLKMKSSRDCVQQLTRLKYLQIRGASHTVSIFAFIRPIALCIVVAVARLVIGFLIFVAEGGSKCELET